MSEIGVLLLVKHLRNKLKRTDRPNSVRIMFLRISYLLVLYLEIHS